MKKLFIILMMTSLLVASVSAIDDATLKNIDADSCEELLEQLDIMGDSVPDGVPFQNELVNLVIGDQNISGNVEIVDGEIIGLECGLSENSTYDLALENLSAINDIILDEDPASAYLELKESGAITIEATGFGKKLKLFFANIAANVMSWFS